MDNYLTQLADVLKTELDVAQELLRTSKLQRASLKGSPTDNGALFKELVDRASENISKLLDLEDARTRIILALSAKTGIPCKELTISRLLEITPSAETHKLKELKPKLSSTLQELVQISQINRYLISRSLSFVEDRMRALNGVMKAVDTYEKTGNKSSAETSTFINKKV